MRTRRRHPRRTRYWGSFLAATWLVSWLAACAPAPAIAVTTDVGSVEVIRGASADLTVTLTRTGEATADVLLTVAGLPANVDAAFAPDTLTGSTLESTLTITVHAAAMDGTHQVTVFGAGSSLAADTTFDLTISSLDVTGTVVLANGDPWGGVEVVGPTGSTTTANDGTFTFEGLAVPYDLALYSDAGTDWVHAFEGLTASDPRLEPFTGLSGIFLADIAGVSGTLSGSGMPLAANHAARICLEGIDRIVWACQQLGPGENTYDFQVIWPSLGPLSGRLHVLAFAWNGAGDAPESYVGYASADVLLSNNDAEVVDIVLSDVPATTTLQGDVVVEGGGSPDRIYSGLRLGPNLTIPLFRDGSGANTFAMPMPVLPGASYDVAAVVGLPMQFVWKTGLGDDAGTLTIPAAPTLLAPDDAVAGVDVATEFEVTSPDPSVLTYVWDGSGGAPTFALTTTRSNVSVPDGTPFGIPMPPATVYAWSVLRMPEGNVDDATRTGHSTANLALETMGNDLGGPGFVGDGAIATSAQRTFTTAP
ncbi:MAG: hypothetical protein R6W77_01410 [Trueperaceae bacterium]